MDIEQELGDRAVFAGFKLPPVASPEFRAQLYEVPKTQPAQPVTRVVFDAVPKPASAEAPVQVRSGAAVLHALAVVEHAKREGAVAPGQPLPEPVTARLTALGVTFDPDSLSFVPQPVAVQHVQPVTGYQKELSERL